MHVQLGKYCVFYILEHYIHVYICFRVIVHVHTAINNGTITRRPGYRALRFV